MIDHVHSVVIQRPIADVFAFVSDVANQPSWDSDALVVQRTTPGSLAVGAAWHVESKPFIGASSCSMRVSAFEENRLAEMEGSPIPSMQARSTWSFEPVALGTRVTRRIRMSTSGWLRLAELLMWVQVWWMQRRGLGRLRQVLEGVGAG